MRSMKWIGAGLAAVLFGLAAPAVAQRAAGGPPDWPCVQRLVPDLSWSAIWTGPSIEELEDNWWSDAEVGQVVRYASSRTVEEGEAIARVRSFAEEAEGDKEHRLTLLFAGLFERITRERTATIEAIRRYSRGQVRQLESIGKTVDELEEARRDNQAVERIERLEQELFWEKRLFDSRQASLRALCEQPYLLEERLSRLVRVISQQL